MVKITKEEFDILQPRCGCPCNYKLIWHESYAHNGIPKYMYGHQNKGKQFTEEHKKKIGKANSIALKGKPSPMKGKKRSDGFSEKCRLRQLGKPSCFKGKHHTPESKLKNSQSNKERHVWNKGLNSKTDSRILCGKNSPNWKGGKGYEPYCEKFNEQKKEEVRNEYDRKCLLCNKYEKNNLTKNNKIMKLSIHHIDGDKKQGCNEKKWYLIPLCMKCHGKINPKNIVYWMQYIKDTLRLYNIRNIWNWWN